MQFRGDVGFAHPDIIRWWFYRAGLP